MESAAVKLEWKGPIGVGTLPVGDEEQKKLAAPHVYLSLQHYPARSVLYVGQSRNFLERLWTHYGNMLGLNGYIRGADGKQFYSPATDYMLERLNEADDLMMAVVEDVKRVRWWYAPLKAEFLDPVESTLIDYALAAKERELVECDNGRRQNFGSLDRITIEMEFEGTVPDIPTSVFPKALEGPWRLPT